jgi:hypothetical protein
MRYVFLPPDCLEGLQAIAKSKGYEIDKDASELCEKVSSLFNTHRMELASLAARDLRFLSTPSRFFGCRRISVFVDDSQLREIDQTNTLLWNAGMQGHVTTYGRHITASIKYFQELRK